MPAAHDTQQRSPSPGGTPSFGRLEQRELEYLSMLDFDLLDRLLFAVLKVRYDPRRHGVTDRISTLARWSGMSYRAVQRSLQSLKRRGILIRTRHGVKGGPRGPVVSWTTTLLPYEDWPTEPLVRLIVGTEAYIKVFYPRREERADNAPSSSYGRARQASPSTMATPERDEGHARQASPSTKDTPQSDEGHATDGRRTRLATRDNLDTYPAISPASSAGEAEQDEDAPLGGSRPPGNPVGASRGGTPRKDVEVALAELADADYELDESRDRPFLVEYTRTHPLVDVAGELAKWAAQDGPRTFNGLKAWLANARPADRTRKRDPYCVEPGCLDRGRGDLQRCVRHLGLAS